MHVLLRFSIGKSCSALIYFVFFVQQEAPLKKVQSVISVVEQNGFIAINEDNLKVEEDGEGWETVCYSKKNRTPEKCSSECSNESRDIPHHYAGEPRVKRIVTTSGDLQPTSKRVISETDCGDGDESLTVNNGEEIIHSTSAAGNITLANGLEVLNEQTSCDADGKSSSLTHQDSFEEKELSDLNVNRYVNKIFSTNCDAILNFPHIALHCGLFRVILF